VNIENGLLPKARSKAKQSFISAGVIISFTIIGILFHEGTKKTVAVSIDGKVQEVRTDAKNVQELLDDLHVDVKKNDYVYPSLDTELKENMKIVWKPAVQVVINIDGEKQKAWTTAETVGQLLDQYKIDLGKHDVINFTKQSSLANNLEIKINRAFEVQLIDGGKSRKVWSPSTTVADFLRQQGIALNENDRVEPGLNEKLTRNSKVSVIRVEKVTDVVEEPIHYAVITKKDSRIPYGEQRIIQGGKTGKKEKKYEVVYENGKIVSKKLISEKIVEKPQDKIVAVGAKKIIRTASRGNADAKEFFVTATAYTPNCSGCSGRTATGINLMANPDIKLIAVDPRIIPLGTKVYVEGYGYAIAGDTGNKIKGYKIDLFFPSKQQAWRWGVRKVKIRIIK